MYHSQIILFSKCPMWPISMKGGEVPFENLLTQKKKKKKKSGHNILAIYCVLVLVWFAAISRNLISTVVAKINKTMSRNQAKLDRKRSLCFFVIFDHHYQSFVSETDICYWALHPPTIEIFPVFPNFLKLTTLTTYKQRFLYQISSTDFILVNPILH